MASYFIVRDYIEKKNRYKKREFRTPKIHAFSLEDAEFKKLFILSKEKARILCHKLRIELEPATVTRTALSTELKVLCALRYFATGSQQKEIGDEHLLGMSQAAVSRSVISVTEAINKILMNSVTFPQPHEHKEVKKAFLDSGGFPGVIGVVGCNHIIIKPPSDIDPKCPSNIYLNENGYHSLNVLIVCNSKLKITYANVEYPGTSLDWFVWKHSGLHAVLEEKFSKDDYNCWLLGNSRLQPNPFLLTPFNDPQTPPEKTYNYYHQRTYRVFARCIRLLKARFRCFRRILRHEPLIAQSIINACIVLHNMCLNDGSDEEEDMLLEDNDSDSEYDIDYLNDDEDAYVPTDEHTHNAAMLKRQNVVHNYFS